MKRLFAPLLILISLAAVSPLHAQNKAYGMQTGNDALVACEAAEARSQDFTLGIACLSWINGAVQAAEPDDVPRPYKPVYCTPQSGGSNGQYKDIFVKFLRSNPAKRHLPAIFLFHQAMAEAFPCS